MSGQAPPGWYTVLAAAEAWGVPPWVIEEEASAQWIDRFVALLNEVYERDVRRRGNAGTGRRLI